MATKSKKKAFVKLQCADCKGINYFTRKSHQRKSGESKLELKKFCSSCRKSVVHKEAKK